MRLLFQRRSCKRIRFKDKKHVKSTPSHNATLNRKRQIFAKWSNWSTSPGQAASIFSVQVLPNVHGERRQRPGDQQQRHCQCCHTGKCACNRLQKIVLLTLLDVESEKHPLMLFNLPLFPKLFPTYWSFWPPPPPPVAALLWRGDGWSSALQRAAGGVSASAENEIPTPRHVASKAPAVCRRGQWTLAAWNSLEKWCLTWCWNLPITGWRT